MFGVVIRTVSASAVAFSAFALASLTVDFRVMMAIIVATRPPPSTRFMTALKSIRTLVFQVKAYLPTSLPANSPMSHWTKPVSATPLDTRDAPNP